MGDRAAFGFEQDNGSIIYLYGHWAGERMFERLARALDRVSNAGRLDDPPYANRIAISDMIGDHDSDVSWGISVNDFARVEHKIPVVSWNKKTVSLHNSIEEEAIITWPIANFISKYAFTQMLHR